MEWSGRAPAPPASDAGMGRVSNGAPPVQHSPVHNLPRRAVRWSGSVHRGAVYLRQLPFADVGTAVHVQYLPGNVWSLG